MLGGGWDQTLSLSLFDVFLADNILILHPYTLADNIFILHPCLATPSPLVYVHTNIQGSENLFIRTMMPELFLTCWRHVRSLDNTVNSLLRWRRGLK